MRNLLKKLSDAKYILQEETFEKMYEKEINQLFDFYYDNYPHEISWQEVREIDPELFNDLTEIGRICRIKKG